MSTLYRKRKPVKKESATKKSRSLYYAEQKKLLKARCGGRCEVCYASLFEQGGDSDHVWGRTGTGARLGWPFCDMVECLAALCRECHEERPTTPDIDYVVKTRSLWRLSKRFGIELGSLNNWSDDSQDLIPIVRELLAKAEVTADEILEGRR